MAVCTLFHCLLTTIYCLLTTKCAEFSQLYRIQRFLLTGNYLHKMCTECTDKRYSMKLSIHTYVHMEWVVQTRVHSYFISFSVYFFFLEKNIYYEIVCLSSTYHNCAIKEIFCFISRYVLNALIEKIYWIECGYSCLAGGWWINAHIISKCALYTNNAHPHIIKKKNGKCAKNLISRKFFFMLSIAIYVFQYIYDAVKYFFFLFIFLSFKIAFYLAC